MQVSLYASIFIKQYSCMQVSLQKKSICTYACHRTVATMKISHGDMYSLTLYMCCFAAHIYVYANMYVCVCMCACIRVHTHTRVLHVYIHKTYIYTCTQECVLACVDVLTHMCIHHMYIYTYVGT